MRVLAGPAQAELVVQRSRFLGLLEVVKDPEEARGRLREAKARYADATHVVHAFRTGPSGSETLGCSDDGEPSGTAGRPVLDVLKGAGGGQCLLLVVRWYGGTKLGTGGLVKAYGDTAKSVIAQAVWVEQRTWVDVWVRVDWADHRWMRNELAAVEAVVENEEFGTEVRIRARVPEGSYEGLQTRTRDHTRGRSEWSTTPRVPGS